MRDDKLGMRNEDRGLISQMSSPHKLAFSGSNMFNIFCNHDNRVLLVKSPLLKKWHFLDLKCNICCNHENRNFLVKYSLLKNGIF